MLDFSSQFTIDFHTKSLKGKENNPGFNPFLLQQKTYLYIVPEWKVSV